MTNEYAKCFCKPRLDTPMMLLSLHLRRRLGKLAVTSRFFHILGTYKDDTLFARSFARAGARFRCKCPRLPAGDILAVSFPRPFLGRSCRQTAHPTKIRTRILLTNCKECDSKLSYTRRRRWRAAGSPSRSRLHVASILLQGRWQPFRRFPYSEINYRRYCIPARDLSCAWTSLADRLHTACIPLCLYTSIF